MEGFFEAVAAFRHGLGTNGNSAFNTTATDLAGDILDGLQTGRAEAVDGGCGASGGETGSKGGCAGDVGSFTIGYLVQVSMHIKSAVVDTDISEAYVLYHLRINV